MANEIDLYQDLEIAERHLKKCEKAKMKSGIKFWKGQIKETTKEIKEQYPELALS